MLQASLYEANIPKSKLLAGEGNRAAKAGQFEDAVSKYSEAISLYPFDHRYIMYMYSYCALNVASSLRVCAIIVSDDL